MTAAPLPASRGLSDARVGTLMAIASMLCVQFGLAVAVGLIDDLGVAGTTWLRLSWAAVLLLVLIRPRRSDFSPAALRACIVLGVVTSGTALLFMAAISRLPLGMASALEFLGPLGVAVARSPGGNKVWPVVAGIGVVLLTRPWSGEADVIGVAFALGAGACWGAYILLTQHVGDEVAGIKSLAVTMPVAALTVTLVAGWSTAPLLDAQLLLVGLGLAILFPLVPIILEFLALRRLTAGAFGTLMSLEPAIALLIGLVALSQVPSPWDVAGIACVVVAGIGAERTGARSPQPGPATG